MMTDIPSDQGSVVAVSLADMELEVWVRPKGIDSMHLVGTIDATGEDRFRDAEALLTELRSAMSEVFEYLERERVAPVNVYVGDQPLDPRVNHRAAREYPDDGLCCSDPSRLADVCLHGGYGPTGNCSFGDDMRRAALTPEPLLPDAPQAMME